MSTLTQVEQQKIADWLATHELPAGLGSEESACSIASINLALTGRLTDNIPDCMSPVIGRWIIGVQDAMPHDMRNSSEWKRLLPFAAGTGRVCEVARSDKILNWVWTRVLPELLPIAEAGGFGEVWQYMLDEEPDAANAAAHAAANAAATYAARAARAATNAANAAAYAATNAANAAAHAAYAATNAANAAAHAATNAANATAYAADAAARAQFWMNVNPCQLLADLIDTE